MKSERREEEKRRSEPDSVKTDSRQIQLFHPTSCPYGCPLRHKESFLGRPVRRRQWRGLVEHSKRLFVRAIKARSGPDKVTAELDTPSCRREEHDPEFRKANFVNDVIPSAGGRHC